MAIELCVNPQPQTALAGFLVKSTVGLATDGGNYLAHWFEPVFKMAGPAIIKIQANSSSNNTDVSAGFDLYMVEN